MTMCYGGSGAQKNMSCMRTRMTTWSVSIFFIRLQAPSVLHMVLGFFFFFPSYLRPTCRHRFFCACMALSPQTLSFFLFHFSLQTHSFKAPLPSSSSARLPSPFPPSPHPFPYVLSTSHPTFVLLFTCCRRLRGAAAGRAMLLRTCNRRTKKYVMECAIVVVATICSNE